MALPDPDPAHDPFIVGVDHPFKVGIGQKARRHISAQSTDLGADRFCQSKNPWEWKRLHSERLAEECLTGSQPRALRFESRRFNNWEFGRYAVSLRSSNRIQIFGISADSPALHCELSGKEHT